MSIIDLVFVGAGISVWPILIAVILYRLRNEDEIG